MYCMMIGDVLERALAIMLPWSLVRHSVLDMYVFASSTPGVSSLVLGYTQVSVCVSVWLCESLCVSVLTAALYIAICISTITTSTSALLPSFLPSLLLLHYC
jgi:hypothetical protein